jgi:hypothetical protein
VVLASNKTTHLRQGRAPVRMVRGACYMPRSCRPPRSRGDEPRSQPGFVLRGL